MSNPRDPVGPNLIPQDPQQGSQQTPLQAPPGQPYPPQGQYQPQPGPGEPQTTVMAPDKARRPWYKKKRFILPLAFLALIIVVSSLAGGGGSDSRLAGVPAASEAAKSAPATTEPAEEPSVEPSDEPAEPNTAAPQPKIKTYSGRGDEVIKFKEALTDPMLVTTSWSGPEDNNTIYAYDSDGNEGDLLVNTIGSYKGTNLINLYEDDNVKALKIEGSGSWKITLKPVSEATAWDGKGTFSSKSDDVINVVDVFDGLDSIRFKSTNAEGNVTVYGLGDDEDLIVNEIGNFSGKYLVPSGVTLLKISSDGRWTMKKA